MTRGRNLALDAVAVATALPAIVLARAATAANRPNLASRARRWAHGVPIAALVVTAPLWLLTLLRGVLYPVFGASNLHNSWGGPTLAGAWAAHLGISVAALLVVSFLLAWWRPPSGAQRRDHVRR